SALTQRNVHWEAVIGDYQIVASDLLGEGEERRLLLKNSYLPPRSENAPAFVEVSPLLVWPSWSGLVGQKDAILIAFAGGSIWRPDSMVRLPGKASTQHTKEVLLE